MRPAISRLLFALPFSGLLAACLEDPGPGGNAGLDLVMAVDAFPDSVAHWSGRRSPIDRTRLLFSFRESQDSQSVARALMGSGLELEPDPMGPPGKRITHTDTEVWIRSSDRKPIPATALEAARGTFGRQLAWVGGLYRSPVGADSVYSPLDSLGGLYCPPPHELRVTLHPPYGDSIWAEEVRKRLKRHSLEVVSAAGFDARWSGIPEGNVYRLADSLPALEPTIVAGTTLGGLPLLSPAD